MTTFNNTFQAVAGACAGLALGALLLGAAAVVLALVFGLLLDTIQREGKP